MLVLSRGKDQSIVIGDRIIVTVLDVRGSKVRIGIDAPDDVRIIRELSVPIDRHRSNSGRRSS